VKCLKNSNYSLSGCDIEITYDAIVHMKHEIWFIVKIFVTKLCKIHDEVSEKC
jgi:hypothetical protein